MTLTDAAQLCPSCHVRLVSEGDQEPWCERCEHNLDSFDASRFDRWLLRTGFGLNARLYRDIHAEGVRRPRITWASLVLFGISFALMALVAGAFAGGIALVVWGNAPQKLLGVVLLAVAWLFRPRLGRLKPIRERYDELTRADAPALFALIDRTAAALGTAAPHHVFIGPEWNAFAHVVGLRRKRVLMLGVPYWVCARPQERVHLLGHELGHFINRDIRRGLLTLPAATMFGELALLTRPVDDLLGRDDHPSIVGFVGLVGRAIARPLHWALTYLLWTIHLVMQVIAARQGHRAEYYADDVALTLAGTKAASMFDLSNDSLASVVGSRARGGAGFAGWRAAIEEARDQLAPRLNRLRQLSLREDASPFGSHPPYGLRHRMLSSAAYRDPKIVLTESEAERIDAELARFEEPYRRVLAHDW